MRIESQYGRYSVKARKSSASGTQQFAPEAEHESAAPERAVSTPSLGGLDSILALQTVDDPLLAKRRAVRHGQNLLDVLDELKADLLVGRIGEGRINRLLSLISRARELSDPELESVIDDIELRAQVELAKLGH